MKLGNPESKLCGKFDKPFKYQYFYARIDQ